MLGNTSTVYRNATVSRLGRVLVSCALGALLIVPSLVRAADRSVCVEVVLRSFNEAEGADERTEAGSRAARDAERMPGSAQPGDLTDAEIIAVMQEAGVLAKPKLTPYLPIGQAPVVYLKRLIEHFITHEPNHVAVQTGCEERLQVELYPLHEGWTVFARYSRHGREERVDQLFPQELSQFAERAVLALLHDDPISTTIKRDNVLRSDSEKSVQRVAGTAHWTLGLGTQVRGGKFDTMQKDGSAESELRVFSPMTLGAGYRAKFENWGLESVLRGGIGTNRQAARKNDEGGHIDFDGSLGLSLHFHHYTNPRGLHSFYVGGGSTFEILWFSALKPAPRQGSDPRNSLVSGGLDVDLIFGWEFMRATSLQFFLQGEVNLPAYAIDTSNYDGTMKTWFPGASIGLGVVF